MGAVSLREEAEERILETGRDGSEAPDFRIERLQGINWHDYYRWRERKPRGWLVRRLMVKALEKKRERLAKLSERLKIVGKRIRLRQESKRALERQRVADARQRIRDEQERIEREQRRLEREKTPLGRLANRLEAKGYRPKPWKSVTPRPTPRLSP
jgi:hypothetical protein